MPDLKYGIRIKFSGSQRFDLSEIVDSIGAERILDLSWKVGLINVVIPQSNPFYDTFDPEVRAVVNSPFERVRIAAWTGTKVLMFANSQQQVVDGEFIGYKTSPKGKKKWIVIKAFDCSWWDVWSGDEKLVDRLREAFLDTKDLAGQPAQ
jgi:hypothetical protein